MSLIYYRNRGARCAVSPEVFRYFARPAFRLSNGDDAVASEHAAGARE